MNHKDTDEESRSVQVTIRFFLVAFDAGIVGALTALSFFVLHGTVCALENPLKWNRYSRKPKFSFSFAISPNLHFRFEERKKKKNFCIYTLFPS